MALFFKTSMLAPRKVTCYKSWKKQVKLLFPTEEEIASELTKLSIDAKIKADNFVSVKTVALSNVGTFEWVKPINKRIPTTSLILMPMVPGCFCKSRAICDEGGSLVSVLHIINLPILRKCPSIEFSKDILFTRENNDVLLFDTSEVNIISIYYTMKEMWSKSFLDEDDMQKYCHFIANIQNAGSGIKKYICIGFGIYYSIDCQKTIKEIMNKENVQKIIFVCSIAREHYI